MDNEIFVSCHGPSLSLLLFETARSNRDQKGLLIGKVCNEVVSKKTDENEINRERKTSIYLEHCIPIDDPDTIGHTGIINRNKLKKYTDILQNKKIVGWYSFRRNSFLLQNSISEMLIHQSLLESLPDVTCQYFVACFMSANVTPNMSTHTFNHIFMRFDPIKGRFEPLRLKIYTLSDKSVSSNGYLTRNLFPTSFNFRKILDGVQKEQPPVESILAIHEKVHSTLKSYDSKLQDVEASRLKLEQEVEALKGRLETVISEEIAVSEPQKEEMKVKTIRFNPNTKYNINRKTNPLKTVVINIPPIVKNVETPKPEPEPKKSYSAAASTSPNSTPKSERLKNSSAVAVVVGKDATLKTPKNNSIPQVPVKTNNSLGGNSDVENSNNSTNMDNTEKKAVGQVMYNN